MSHAMHYAIRARMDVDADWHVIAYANTEDGLKECLTKAKLTWRHVQWNSYRAAPKKDGKNK